MRSFAALLACLVAAGCVGAPSSVPPAPPTGDALAPAAAASAAPVADERAGDASGVALANWTLDGALSMGYVAALGPPFAEPAVAQNDATRCGRAVFVVPEGATLATLSLQGDLVAAGNASAGAQYLWITPPAGDEFDVDPFLSSTFPAGEPPDTRILESPPPGEWTAQMRAMGVVVAQSFPFRVTIEGASAVAPAVLEITCTDS